MYVVSFTILINGLRIELIHTSGFSYFPPERIEEIQHYFIIIHIQGHACGT